MNENQTGVTENVEKEKEQNEVKLTPPVVRSF